MSPYPLQTLLGLRERAKEEAERALAEAAQALAREEALRDEQAQALARAREQREAQGQAHLAQVLAQGADAGALQVMGRHEAQRREWEAAQAGVLQRQGAVVEEAAQALEARRRALAEAARELEVLQTHRERWAEARAREREAREEQVQEEVASALLLARQRK